MASALWKHFLAGLAPMGCCWYNSPSHAYAKACTGRAASDSAQTMQMQIQQIPAYAHIKQPYHHLKLLRKHVWCELAVFARIKGRADSCMSLRYGLTFDGSCNMQRGDKEPITHLTRARNSNSAHPCFLGCFIMRGTKLPKDAAQAPAVLCSFPVRCLKVSCLSLLDCNLQLLLGLLQRLCSVREGSELAQGRCLEVFQQMVLWQGKDVQIGRQHHSPLAASCNQGPAL